MSYFCNKIASFSRKSFREILRNSPLQSSFNSKRLFNIVSPLNLFCCKSDLLTKKFSFKSFWVTFVLSAIVINPIPDNIMFLRASLARLSDPKQIILVLFIRIWPSPQSLLLF